MFRNASLTPGPPSFSAFHETLKSWRRDYRNGAWISKEYIQLISPTCSAYLDYDKGIVKEVELGWSFDGGETAGVGMVQGKLLTWEDQPSTFVPEGGLCSVHVCTWVRECVYNYVNMCIYKCVCEWVIVFVCVCVCVCVCVYIAYSSFQSLAH